MAEDLLLDPWERLADLLHAGDMAALRAFLSELSPGETARALSRLERDDLRELFDRLPDDVGADVVEELSDGQAVQILEVLEPRQGAAFLDRLPSNRQTDLLGLLPAHLGEALLRAMLPDEAADVLHLRRYEPDTAGGIMVTEFFAYPDKATVGEVVADLRDNSARYADYVVQYVYVVSEQGLLVGVLRFRDLLLSAPHRTLASIMIPEPIHLPAETSLDDLADFFERRNFFGVPITDGEERLIGVVRRADLSEALAERADRALGKFSGLVGGEELRTMPLSVRSRRRLLWLGITIALNLLSASVIALFQDTLSQVIALAVFLPVISGMCGSSGNQAIAVSMRELTLGLIQPKEMSWVLMKESAVGMINGLVLGLALGIVAAVWKGNAYLGLVVGTALALGTVVAVCLGGGLPLILKRLEFDAALAAGPILMTLADLCGFLFALGFATLMLGYLT